MADPYHNFFKGYYFSHGRYMLPSTSSTFQYVAPPSPPVREALPLLSLSPSYKAPAGEHNSGGGNNININISMEEAEEAEEEEEEEEAVSVALHIGLPSLSEADLISRVSSTSVNEDKDGAGDGAGAGAGEEDEAIPLGQPAIGKLTRGQYWIPTPSQILIGPTQFSCPVCCKTFNRYNNMQVRVFGIDLTNQPISSCFNNL